MTEKSNFLALITFIFLFVNEAPGLEPGAWNQNNVCMRGPLLQNMQNITCVTKDLRTAVQRDKLLRRISQTNFFSEISPNDVVRSREFLSIFDQSLKQKISDTHENYQSAGKSYTLSISFYPSAVKENSCSKQKTIDFDSPPSSDESEKSFSESVFGFLDDAEADEENIEISEKPIANYIHLPGKNPRIFHTRWHKNKWVMCEDTKINYAQRLKKFCGSYSEIDSEEDSEVKKYKSCKRSLTSSCQELDREGAQMSGPSPCASMNHFANLSKDLLMSNTALEWKYCPGDCSYYTQTLQAFYKNQVGEYCSDSYLVVHCGPKKKGGEYNLNIREINDLCRDFGTCTF